MQDRPTLSVNVLKVLADEAESWLHICVPSLRHRLDTANWITEMSDYERLLGLIYPMVLDAITSFTEELTRHRFDVTSAITLAIGNDVAVRVGLPVNGEQVQ
ncbi:hypothetical protein [uncultured Nocardioides sp.]|nr:hypothetical protein [uncultured Nocardioides sp.]